MLIFVSVFMVALAAWLAQQTQIPAELLSLIGLVFGTLSGTAVVKRIIAWVAMKGKIPTGDAARIITWVVAYGLTFLSIAYGWVHLSAIVCSDPSTCIDTIAFNATLIAAIAGLVYDPLHKMFSGEPEPAPAPSLTKGKR